MPHFQENLMRGSLTICSFNCLPSPSCPSFCCKVSPPMPSLCPSSCSVSCILQCQQPCCQEHYPPNVSTQSPAICPSQCAIRCDNMCLAHYCPAPSEQSMFLTKSTPTGNVKPNFSPPQSYASPTPYAPVLAHRTVHTVVPSIVAWGNKNLHTYSKLWNKDHRFEGLLRFKKPNISWKLYSFRAGFYQVLWSYTSLCTFETVLLPALKYALMLGENRCLYISGRKKAQITKPRNTTKTTKTQQQKIFNQGPFLNLKSVAP